MYLSGFGLESKFETLQMFPDHLRPQSILVRQGTPFSKTLETMRHAGLGFPVIVKPDLGFRGFLVTKIASEQELRDFLQKYPADFIIQEFLDFPEEVGVFYVKIPGDTKGKIISLTLKEFLHVTGDGRSSVRDLIAAKPRALLQMERLEQTHAHVLDSVPAPGEKVSLGVVGNHSKGTLFINGTDQADERLAEVFDRLADAMPGFYYGRFDIKCESLDLLKEGKGFKFIELNGICSEPTHIYDQSRMTYPGALRTILRHWTLVARISAMNHRNGVPFMPVGQVIRAFKDLSAYQKRLAAGQ